LCRRAQIFRGRRAGKRHDNPAAEGEKGFVVRRKKKEEGRRARGKSPS